MQGRLVGTLVAALVASVGCSDSGSDAGSGEGGTVTGGVPGTGASSAGGVATGGTGGSSTGGSSTGGSSTGGSSTGGAGTGGAGTGGSSTGGASHFRLPEANAPFDYQIGGAYTPPAGVAVVSRDRESSPAPGLYNICYVNGFQIQPGEESWWEANHPDLILRDANGDPVVDAGWDEMLLDTSTAAKRTALADIVGGWIDQCAADGFDAVEVDNLDSYSRSSGLLTEANNVAFMGLLSAVGHASGLAMGQKNSVEILGSAAAMGTDFAVAEECNRWDECGEYQATYGNLVFVIEYRDQDFTQGCADFPELSIVRRDVNVSTPSSGEYVYDGC